MRPKKELIKLSKNVKHLEKALTTLLGALDNDQGESIALIASQDSYKVQNGDSLGKIAQKFGTTTKSLKEVNNLKKDTIYVGQNLILP
ncbi:LysM peptidoglycan-binding domain-containing protein [Chlamydiales bacterium]|nr:LysM peptidoglycan-binding domain-containing protein [Chlamydiales bacterium]